MITAGRIVVAVFLTIVALADHRAAASWIGEKAPDRILIADPSPHVRSYLLGRGFAVESVERLEALDLSLMVAVPPSRVPATVALRDLQAAFPSAVAALDDHFYVAHDTRSGRGKTVARQRILATIGWRSDEADPGTGLRIGVIDSAIDLAHPALRDAHIFHRDFTSGNTPTEDTAHGTAVAAMLVGRPDNELVSGLLRGATLFHASIFQQGSQGPIGSSADFLRAVNWLIESGVTVINASVTSPAKNPIVLYAMQMLSHESVILVAAAGNRGPSAPPVYPAGIDSAFAVTAVSVDGDAYRYANAGDYIDISAPGIDLPTTSGKVTSGTSLAVPFVTAAVARLMKACGLSSTEAEGKLQANAQDLGPRGWDSHFGWGLLQAPLSCGGNRDRHP